MEPEPSFEAALAVTTADRLRALEEALVPAPWPESLRRSVGDGVTTFHIEDADAMSLLAIRNALPGLIAVVEAAENLADATDDEWFYGGGRAQTSRALADLDRALGGGE